MLGFFNQLSLFLAPITLGINTFIAIYFIFYGLRKKIGFNTLVGSILLIFSTAFIRTILSDEKYGISFQYYFDIDACSFSILYIYVLHLINHKINTWHYLVFIPAVIQLVLTALSLSFQYSLSEPYSQMFTFFSVVFSSVLVIISYKKIRLFELKVKEYFSLKEDFKGIKLILLFTFSFNVFWLVSEHLIHPGKSVYLMSQYISELVSYAMVIYLSVWLLNRRSKELEYSKMESDVKRFEEEASESKEALKNHVLYDEKIYKNINDLLEQKQLYLDVNLSLADLSNALNEKTKTISQHISHFSDSTFYNFINAYRVAHFKTLIKQKKNDEMSIDGLIEMCGFKSKSTFYSHFKRIEGCTPKEFIKNRSAV